MKQLGLLLAIAVSMPVFAQSGSNGSSGSIKATPYKEKKHAPVHNAQGVRGEVVFQENCARCHNPPQGFSPRISQTVAMHMRVRANLSEADYKALVRFLNP